MEQTGNSISGEDRLLSLFILEVNLLIWVGGSAGTSNFHNRKTHSSGEITCLALVSRDWQFLAM